MYACGTECVCMCPSKNGPMQFNILNDTRISCFVCLCMCWQCAVGYGVSGEYIFFFFFSFYSINLYSFHLRRICRRTDPYLTLAIRTTEFDICGVYLFVQILPRLILLLLDNIFLLLLLRATSLPFFLLFYADVCFLIFFFNFLLQLASMMRCLEKKVIVDTRPLFILIWFFVLFLDPSYLHRFTRNCQIQCLEHAKQPHQSVRRWKRTLLIRP